MTENEGELCSHYARKCSLLVSVATVISLCLSYVYSKIELLALYSFHMVILCRRTNFRKVNFPFLF